VLVSADDGRDGWTPSSATAPMRTWMSLHFRLLLLSA
jgi:hypothetical protein